MMDETAMLADNEYDTYDEEDDEDDDEELDRPAERWAPLGAAATTSAVPTESRYSNLDINLSWVQCGFIKYVIDESVWMCKL